MKKIILLPETRGRKRKYEFPSEMFLGQQLSFNKGKLSTVLNGAKSFYSDKEYSIIGRTLKKGCVIQRIK